MFKKLKAEIDYIRSIDPAAHSRAEVLFLYPSIHVLISHRFAHRLYKRQWYFLARMISQWARFFTGIEIHPGATIGKHFFIDHGMGVVIGETTIIGNYVTLYHGVTLGGRGVAQGVKRHPTVEDHVIIGAGATILGDITLGKGSKVGAGSVLIQDLEEGRTAVGCLARSFEKRKMTKPITE